jgi:hypothetical protein
LIAPWVIQILIAVAMQIVAYVLQPKVKAARPDAVRDFDGPTAEAGRPVPVVVGDVTLKSPNVLHTSDKGSYQYQVRA